MRPTKQNAKWHQQWGNGHPEPWLRVVWSETVFNGSRHSVSPDYLHRSGEGTQHRSAPFLETSVHIVATRTHSWHKWTVRRQSEAADRSGDNVWRPQSDWLTGECYWTADSPLVICVVVFQRVGRLLTDEHRGNVYLLHDIHCNMEGDIHHKNTFFTCFGVCINNTIFKCCSQVHRNTSYACKTCKNILQLKNRGS